MALLYPTTTNGLQKTLGAQLDAGTTASMTLNNTTGIQNKPGVVVINRIDTDGNEKSASLREYIQFTAVSGSTLTGLTRNRGGSTDQDHANGSVVEFILDVDWAQAVCDALGNMVNTTTLAVDTTKLVTPTGTQTLTNKTLTAPVLSGSVTGTYGIDGTPTITGAITKPGVTAISGATPGMDLNVGNQFSLTLSEAAALAVTNETVGQCFLLQITQDAGASEYAVTWPSTVHWVSGTAPTLTLTASAVDLLGFRVTATDTYQGYVIGQAITTV